MPSIFLFLLLLAGQTPPPSGSDQRFDDAEQMMAALVLVSFGLLWGLSRVKKRQSETESLELIPKSLDSMTSGPQQSPEPTTLRYSEQEFRGIVTKVLDDLPEEFDKEWENVAVIVSTEWATDADKKKMGVPEGNLLLGTYSGIARTKGQWFHVGSRNVIVIYQPALELRCGSNKELLEREIRRTVLHELAHHLGMSHQRMKEIGL